MSAVLSEPFTGKPDYDRLAQIPDLADAWVAMNEREVVPGFDPARKRRRRKLREARASQFDEQIVPSASSSREGEMGAA